VSSLEEIEKLEQLRWLENDFKIHVSLCVYESIAIDTREDLEKVMENYSRIKN
jgi:3-deoxy-manno-octulosonate cytidylyltransferase (CMP-KDO synthetase)